MRYRCGRRGFRCRRLAVQRRRSRPPDVIPCLPCGSDDVLEVEAGKIDARAGQAAYDALVMATRLALAGRVQALTTAPLQKEALHRAGHNYPGHTELLAEMCGVQDFAMMLYLGPDEEIVAPAGLAVVHVTLHTAMRNVFEAMTEDAVLSKSRLAHQFMSRLKGSRPRIGVCSLNPHGGEGGLFGDEEIRIIRPAVVRGLAEGLDLVGPLPTDTLMVRAREGRFDAIVAMYHDQGPHRLEIAGDAQGGQRDAWIADCADERCSRDCLRHRLATARGGPAVCWKRSGLPAVWQRPRLGDRFRQPRVPCPALPFWPPC